MAPAGTTRGGLGGEQSLKRIETAGERASGGLKGLGRQAELLRTGIRTLGGALAGVATVGGLAALVDRSISADAIGKTADKIGVGVEALQELRFAAKASGGEQQTLDMALQRFTRRAAEAAQGRGKAKDALASIGIAFPAAPDDTTSVKERAERLQRIQQELGSTLWRRPRRSGRRTSASWRPPGGARSAGADGARAVCGPRAKQALGRSDGAAATRVRAACGRAVRRAGAPGAAAADGRGPLGDGQARNDQG